MVKKNKLYNLISPSLFNKAFNNLFKENYSFETTNYSERHLFKKIKMSDGAIVYPKRAINVSVEDVRDLAIQYISNKNLYHLKKDSGFEILLVDELKDLLNKLKEKNISVDLFLSPYHPLVYDFINKNYPLVDSVEKWVIDNYGENLYGSFNPVICNYPSSFFRDGMHLKDMYSNELLNRPTNISTGGF